MNRSVLFYVQHLLGIGHLRRALHIVEALVREGLDVTLVSGGEPLPDLAASAAARVVQLAPIRVQDAGFKDLVDAGGRAVDEALRTSRRKALLDAFAAARPGAVVIEAFPFGRRAFRFELDPLIAAAREGPDRALVLCSLRDIVVAPQEEARRRAIIERLHADFDAVLVHGDPSLIPLEVSFAEASEIADLLVYTGYVAARTEAGSFEEDEVRDEILVSAGGGGVGGALLATALEARRRGCFAFLRWRLLTGPNLSDAEFAKLAARLPAGVVIERYRRDFPRLLRRCRVSVSQAGYNTVLDILGARAPAVLVPFAELRESEQTLRAETLAARRIVEAVAPTELSPDRLAAAIERAAESRPAMADIDISGAGRTAQLIAGMIEGFARPGMPPIQDFVTSPGDDSVGT